MINDLIDKDRVLGCRVGKPEGLFCSTVAEIDGYISGKIGDKEIDEDIREAVVESFYSPENTVDGELIDKLVADMKPQVAQEKNSSVITEEGTTYYFVDHGKELDFFEMEGFAQIVSELKQYAESFYGSEVKFDHASTGWSEPVESGKDRLPSGWHLDWHLRASKLRLFVFLSDESVRDVPLQLVDREKTVDIMSEHDIQSLNQNSGLVEEKAELNEFKGGKGSFVVFNPATHLHRATAPTGDGEMRKALMVDFVPKYS